jgi:hypothetical protein
VLSNRWNPGGCPRRWAALARPTTSPKLTSPRPFAVSDDPGALVSGGYFYHRFYHRAPRDVPPAVRSGSLQDELLDELAQLTGERLSAG